MKKQTILKSTLCLLFTLMCHVAWAATGDIIDVASGYYTVQCDGNNKFANYNGNGRIVPLDMGRFPTSTYLFTKGEDGRYTIQTSDEKYVTYKGTGTGDQIALVDAASATDANKWWVLREGKSAGLVTIVPKQDNIGDKTPGWNYAVTINGIANSALGLWDCDDNNSQWLVKPAAFMTEGQAYIKCGGNYVAIKTGTNGEYLGKVGNKTEASIFKITLGEGKYTIQLNDNRFLIENNGVKPSTDATDDNKWWVIVPNIASEGTVPGGEEVDIIAASKSESINKDTQAWNFSDHTNGWNSGLAYWSASDNGSKCTVEWVRTKEQDEAHELIELSGKVGYPKETSTVHTALVTALESNEVSALISLPSLMDAYKISNDIVLPEDGKAYKIVNYSNNPSQQLRYLNYTKGAALSVKTDEDDASVFICRELSTGVYVLVTEDGKFLTWPHSSDGYKEDGSFKGYSNNYATEYEGYSDWNKIAIKKNGTTDSDFGHLRMVARRYYSEDKKAAPNSSFIVKGSTGVWDRAGDSYYLDKTGNNWYSSAWILTEVEHTNTTEQSTALDKIDAIAHVEANASKLGEGIGYAHYMIGETKSTDAVVVKTAINNAATAEEVNAISNSLRFEIPQRGVRYMLYDTTCDVYLDIHNLGEEPGRNGSENRLATTNDKASWLYIPGNENDGTWKIHTTLEGGQYLHQSSGYTWNSWVSDAGGSFKWEVERIDVSGTPHYMLKNISGSQNGYLGADSHSSGNPLYVNQSAEEKRLKIQLIPVKSITGAGTTAAEWLNEKCVDVATVDEIPEGIKGLSNYNSFVDDNYTHKIKTYGEYFYINAGHLSGLFRWRSGSGNKRVNIVAVEVVDLAGTVVDADYHWGYAGNPSSNNTYEVDIPEDGLYYLRYYAETASNDGINNSDIDITYTLVESKVYIAADAKQPDGTYKKYYLYNDNGTLKASVSCNSEAKYKWNRSRTEAGNYTFANEAGKYLGYDHTGVKGLVIADTPVELVISTADAVHAGAMGLKRVGDDSDGKFMVTKYDGSSFNRNSGKVNNGTWTSDYIFTPSTLKAFTIVANVPESEAVFTCGDYELEVGASMLCSGITGKLGIKSCKSTYALEGFYSDAAYTNKITEVDVAVLGADMTIYAKFTPNIFSAKYGEKWINIVRAANANHAAALGNTAEGTIPTFNDLDYTNRGMIWCFVGDANNFKIYNLLSGEGLALIPSGELNDGVSVEMGAATKAQNWYIKEYSDGYAIIPVGNQEWGINSYTGIVGSQIKFYGVGDKGTHWNFSLIDTKNTLTLDVQVEGTQPYANNTRVAYLNATLAGHTSTSIVKSSTDSKTYYLPMGATFTLNQWAYRGYKFNGFVGTDGNTVQQYTNATLPEGGLDITASYSVDEDNKYQYLFYYRDDVNNKPYRIPAITTARNNTVLAFSDYRPCSNDIGYGEVDIMLRRSYDNGKTWSDAVCIADGQGGDSNVFNVGFGDAAVVADRESGKVLVMAVAGKQVFGYGSATGHNSMAKIVSNDNGEHWSDPKDVTSQFMIEANSLFPEAYTMFFGSGRILQSRVYKAEGADYYRIYGALLVKHADNNYTGNCNFVVYSDDFGESWEILGGSITAGMCCAGGDEPKVEELSDGTIILSSRKGSGRYFNVFTFTDKENGLGTWGSAVASNNQTGGISFGGNSTNGEIYKVKAIRNTDGQICDVMLQSIPTGGGRSNVSVYYKEMSYDEAYTPATFAQNWTKGLEVSAIGSAYSTMTLQADGNFGFFYEEEPGDQWAYCMVYVPLSVEEMTNGAYSLVHLELNEGDNVASFENMVYKQVVVNRTIKAPEAGKVYGNWNTFVVPFDMAIPDEWEVKELESSELKKDNITLIFEDAKNIKAGVPYMVRTKEKVEKIVAQNVKVENKLNSVETGDIKFMGTYTNGYVPEGAFFISSNTFYRSAAENSNTIKAFRAYLMPTTADSQAALSLSYRTDGETTAIDNSQLTNDNGTTVVAIYNQQGVHLDDMQEGVNILQMSDGRVVKMIIK